MRGGLESKEGIRRYTVEVNCPTYVVIAFLTAVFLIAFAGCALRKPDPIEPGHPARLAEPVTVPVRRPYGAGGDALVETVRLPAGTLLVLPIQGEPAP